MKRVFGFILVALFGLASVIVLSPFVVIGLLVWGTLKSVCMAKGKHKFAISELLQGRRPEDLLCVLCRHKASGNEPNEIRMEYAESLKKLIDTKNFLDGIFKTQEERAIDDIIKDSSIPPEKL